jgi:hypothetical protein
MTTPPIIEQRLAALEQEVAQLKAQLQQLRKPEKNGIENMIGCMKDIPQDVWEEFQRYCAEVKQEGRERADEP